jgi:hypothetical protein
MDEFSQVRKPPHVGQKPTTCGVCHTQDDWHPSVLNHPWALTGAHAKSDACFECHKGDPPEFRGTPKACFGCHAADYQRGPNHVAAHFPTTCESCHSTTAWKPLLPTAKMTPKTPPGKTTPAPADSDTPKIVEPKGKETKPKPHATASPAASAPDVTTGASHYR